MSELNIAEAIISIKKKLKKNDIKVSQHSNFENFKKLADSTRALAGAPAVSGHFHNALFDLNEENAFWLKFTKHKKIISIAAYRLDRLGNDTLSHFWINQYSRIYAKPNDIGTNHSGLAGEITGNIAYVGEFSMPPEEQGNGLGGIMVFLGMMLCVSRWRELDWLYGLMSASLAKNGGSVKMGFDRVRPNGTDWIVAPDGIKSTDWICAIKRQEMLEWADLIATEGLEVLLPRHTI